MKGQGGWSRALATVFIATGVLLLVLRQFAWQVSDSLWPLVIVIPGVAIFAVAAILGRDGKWLAVIGAITAGAGLILLIQDLTDYFQSWAYAWTLLPVFAGLSLLYTGARSNDASAAGMGRGLVLSGLVTFALFAAVFEGLIFHGGLIGNSLVLPLVLIAVGVGFLFRQMGGGASTGDKKGGDTDPRTAG